MLGELTIDLDRECYPPFSRATSTTLTTPFSQCRHLFRRSNPGVDLPNLVHRLLTLQSTLPQPTTSAGPSLIPMPTIVPNTTAGFYYSGGFLTWTHLFPSLSMVTRSLILPAGAKPILALAKNPSRSPRLTKPITFTITPLQWTHPISSFLSSAPIGNTTLVPNHSANRPFRWIPQASVLLALPLMILTNLNGSSWIYMSAVNAHSTASYRV